MLAEYEVTAVRYGTRTTSRAHTFYNYSLYKEPDAALDLDYFFWIIRNEAETILVDSGFGFESGRRRGRTQIINPVSALAQFSIDPGDVTKIVASHFHYDHIGNLGAFPNATITIQQAEYDFWTGPYASRLPFAEVSEVSEIDYLKHAKSEGRVEAVTGDVDIASGVRAQLVGGHCPGQQIVVVDQPSRPIVIASDSLHFYEEVDRDMPFLIFSDLERTYAAYETLRQMEHDGAVLVAGHDPLVMERFAPVESVQEGLAVKLA